MALIHPAATWPLTERFGKFRSVFGGAARVYLPEFAEDADPYSHRLVLADQIATPEGAARCTSWFRRPLTSVCERWTRADLIIQSSDDFTQEVSQPSQDEAEVVSGGGEDGVGVIASAAFQVVSAEVAL